VITLERIDEVRAHCDDARRRGSTVGFVPTMGFFHDGHVSLMDAARANNDVVVVSLFVNPTQFGPNEDLGAYPRDAEGDARRATAAGVDVLFAPSVAEMYPRPMLTSVRVDGVTDGLCGASRPHHFGGVATVVTKLLSIVGPCTAYFGKKDYQQLVVVRRLVADLDLPVEVVGCPIVREPDGLAMSSRNAYLSPDERPAAAVLYRALEGALKTVMSGERNAARVRDAAVEIIGSEPLVNLEYAEVVRGDDLRPVAELEDGVEHVVALAARAGTTRLIDNATFTTDRHDLRFDLYGFGTPRET
jgi:pantoate--beta-alanine ligase